MENRFYVSPIGIIRVRNGEYCLEIIKEYHSALEGLEGFSHINVLWWFNQFDSDKCRRILTCEQPYKNSPPKLGIFATRSPVRPNPIALTTAAIINVDLNMGLIKLDYIDAEDNTPVLDLKPYYPCSDKVREVSTPSWSSHWPDCREESASFDWGAEFVNAR